MRSSKTAAEKLKRLYVYAFLIVGLAVTIFPFLWMVETSFKPQSEIFKIPPTWIPEQWTLEHYRQLFREMNFGRSFLNSFIVAISVTLLGLFVNALAGYGFAKYRFPGRNKIFLLLIVTMMVPGQVTMIPVFMLLKLMGLLNSYTGLILPSIATVFGIFLFRQFIQGIPDELLEAARIDGCSEWRIFWTIILPLSKPVIATYCLFTFMGSWNEFIWALIIMLDEKKYTLPVALANLNGQYHTEYGLLMAGSLLVILPILILFLWLQRYYIRGITITGLKG